MHVKISKPSGLSCKNTHLNASLFLYSKKVFENWKVGPFFRKRKKGKQEVHLKQEHFLVIHELYIISRLMVLRTDSYELKKSKYQNWNRKGKPFKYLAIKKTIDLLKQSQIESFLLSPHISYVP